MRTYEEYSYCKSLVDWCRVQKILILHIANEGKREFNVCHDLGIVSGVSDYFVPFPRCGYQGLWIEMKAKGKKPTPRQELFLDLMHQLGYMTAWCDSWEEARDIIVQYFADETIDELHARIGISIKLMDTYWSKDRPKPADIDINAYRGAARVTQPWRNARKLCEKKNTNNVPPSSDGAHLKDG